MGESAAPGQALGIRRDYVGRTSLQNSRRFDRLICYGVFVGRRTSRIPIGLTMVTYFAWVNVGAKLIFLSRSPTSWILFLGRYNLNIGELRELGHSLGVYYAESANICVGFSRENCVDFSALEESMIKPIDSMAVICLN